MANIALFTLRLFGPGINSQWLTEEYLLACLSNGAFPWSLRIGGTMSCSQLSDTHWDECHLSWTTPLCSGHVKFVFVPRAKDLLHLPTLRKLLPSPASRSRIRPAISVKCGDGARVWERNISTRLTDTGTYLLLATIMFLLRHEFWIKPKLWEIFDWSWRIHQTNWAIWLGQAVKCVQIWKLMKRWRRKYQRIKPSAQNVTPDFSVDYSPSIHGEVVQLDTYFLYMQTGWNKLK